MSEGIVLSRVLMVVCLAWLVHMAYWFNAILPMFDKILRDFGTNVPYETAILCQCSHNAVFTAALVAVGVGLVVKEFFLHRPWAFLVNLGTLLLLAVLNYGAWLAIMSPLISLIRSLQK
jgi:type II secretory pathway component PulF